MEPIRVRLMSQRGRFDEADLTRRMPGGTLDHGDVVFDLDGEEPADVVVIQNYLRYDQEVSAREGYIWKWDNEPIVARPIAPGYDRVFTHLDLSGRSIAQTAPPILDWWIGKSYDELAALAPPEKPQLVSAIASTKVDIPGHRARHDFIERAIRAIPELEVFGHGRPRQLEDKWEGLGPFRYSLAIENTSKPDYWSEKIADCFLSYTVPFYFGATNISDYFPKDSFIWLPIDKPDHAIDIIAETLATDDPASRIDALKEARHRILHEYSFYAQISSRVRLEATQIRGAKRTERLVHGRRTKPGGWLRGKGLIENLRARRERRRQRLLRQQLSG